MKIYRGVLQGMYQIGRYDGIKALQKGLVPAFGFQFVLNAVRYESKFFKQKSKNKHKMENILIILISYCSPNPLGWAFSIQPQRMAGLEIRTGTCHFGAAISGVDSLVQSVLV